MAWSARNGVLHGNVFRRAGKENDIAGDWIKMRSNLWDDPRIAKICDMTDLPEASVIGGLYWIWATADQHTEDGIMHGLTARAINRKIGLNGFAEALFAIEWLEECAEGIRIIDFEKHNGVTAKKRCQTAKRVANFTANNARNTDLKQSTNATNTNEYNGTNADCVSSALAREREREDKELTTTDVVVVAGKPTPNCPHQKIIDLYAKHLPELPYPRIWEGQRQQNLAARWRWVLTAKKPDGAQRATDTESALSFFDRFFGHVAKSDFLTGRDGKWGGCDLGWLMKSENFSKAISGNYDKRIPCE